MQLQWISLDAHSCELTSTRGVYCITLEQVQFAIHLSCKATVAEGVASQ
jgi:hypothetical protein